MGGWSGYVECERKSAGSSAATWVYLSVGRRLGVWRWVLLALLILLSLEGVDGRAVGVGTERRGPQVVARVEVLVLLLLTAVFEEVRLSVGTDIAVLVLAGYELMRAEICNDEDADAQARDCRRRLRYDQSRTTRGQ